MAAQNGHVEAAETLLGRGAQMEASHNVRTVEKVGRKSDVHV